MLELLYNINPMLNVAIYAIIWTLIYVSNFWLPNETLRESEQGQELTIQRECIASVGIVALFAV